MEKRLIDRKVVLLTADFAPKWKEIKDLPFDDEDLIIMDYVDDVTYTVIALRQTLETDEEFEKRRTLRENYEAIQKKQRLAEYEKLKKEFES